MSGAGAGGLITEQRAVAVARCISAGEGGQSEIRSRAVLALANAASFPFSDGLRELMQVWPVTQLGDRRGHASMTRCLCRGFICPT